MAGSPRRVAARAAGSAGDFLDIGLLDGYDDRAFSGVEWDRGGGGDCDLPEHSRAASARPREATLTRDVVDGHGARFASAGKGKWR